MPRLCMLAYRAGREVGMSEDTSEGWLYTGAVIGAGFGFWISILFIFPPDVLSTKFSDMTIGFFLRIFGGLCAVCWGAVVGGMVCVLFWGWVDKQISYFKNGRNSRIEQFGKCGSIVYKGHLNNGKVEADETIQRK